jgi:hypothetical protein
MRKIVVSEFVSLDGVMEDPGGAEGYEFGGWTIPYWATSWSTSFAWPFTPSCWA